MYLEGNLCTSMDLRKFHRIISTVVVSAYFKEHDQGNATRTV